MTAFIAHIGLHLFIVLTVLIILGRDLRTVYGDNKLLIPGLNLMRWEKQLIMPSGLSIVLLQCLWLPYNWLIVAALVYFIFLFCRTLFGSRFSKGQTLVFIISSILFCLSFFLIKSYYLYIFLIMVIAGGGLISRFKENLHSLGKEVPSADFQVIKRFLKSGRTKVCMIALLLIVHVGMYAPYLANSVPLFGKSESSYPTPITSSILHGSEVDSKILRDIDNPVFAPIQFLPQELDQDAMGFQPPNTKHLLGTDRIGRDIMSGMIYGAQTAVTLGFIVVLISLMIGLPLGLAAGFYGDSKLKTTQIRAALTATGVLLGSFYALLVIPNLGLDLTQTALFAVAAFVGCSLLLNVFGKFLERTSLGRKSIHVPLDSIIMRFIEILNSVPALLLIIIVASLIHYESLTTLMIVIGMISWTSFARLIRSETMRISQLNYVEASRAIGAKDRRIMLSHILPNALPPILVHAAFGIAGAILIESTLSFLQIGVPPESVSWGSILNLALTNNISDKLWLIIAPGLAIFIMVMVLNILGESIQRAFNPKQND